MTAPDWQALYTAERAARLDAEARLRGLMATLALALVGAVAICALAGCLRASNDVSRAVARWEVLTAMGPTEGAEG